MNWQRLIFGKHFYILKNIFYGKDRISVNVTRNKVNNVNKVNE